MNVSGDTNHHSLARRWLIVSVFAVAMAWVEAAVVFYLRTMIHRIQPYQPNPLPDFAGLVTAEIAREAATMIMLLAVGWLAGHNRLSRAGFAVAAFGIWDLFYYVFLKVLSGWPASPLDWDLLFLIPLPWWGPVLAPCLIAALMIAWGALVARLGAAEAREHPGWRVLLPFGAGALIALYVFMADAIAVAPQGEAALRQMLPGKFQWPLFALGWLLMTAPAVEAGRQFLGRRLLAGSPPQPA